MGPVACRFLSDDAVIATLDSLRTIADEAVRRDYLRWPTIDSFHTEGRPWLIDADDPWRPRSTTSRTGP